MGSSRKFGKLHAADISGDVIMRADKTCVHTTAFEQRRRNKLKRIFTGNSGSYIPADRVMIEGGYSVHTTTKPEQVSTGFEG